MDLLDGLNPEQQEVVLHNKGPMLVASCAGSGKTFCLVRRVAYLLKERNVPSSRILAVTFSKKGADEMNERLIALLGRTDARIGTFHSLGLEIIRAEIPKIQDWQIDASGSKYRICIKDAIGYQGMNWDTGDPHKINRFISRCKAEQVGWSDLKVQEIARLYSNPYDIDRYIEAYQRADDLRTERQLLTFDDMLFLTVDLFQKHDEIRRRWAEKFDYVIQDEAQDMNLGQLLLGELLAKDHGNYTLIGDPGQTIFSWRGAHPDKLLNFEQAWGAKVVKMGRNYRCGQEIIEKANAALDSMDPATKLDMRMLCERRTNAEITVYEYSSLDQEGEAVAEEIQTLAEDGVEYKDICILSRTNGQTRAPEESLLARRIPYRILGGTNFYERREIKGIIAHLRLAEGRGTIDDACYCINMPFKYLGKVFLSKLRNTGGRLFGEGSVTGFGTLIEEVIREENLRPKQANSARTWASMVDEFAFRIENGKNQQMLAAPPLEESKPARIVEDFLMRTQYTAWLSKSEGEETPEESRVSNVREFWRVCERFSTASELLDYIERTIENSKEAKKNEDSNVVTLSTIHKFKGLERKVVFLIGAAERILPHVMCEDTEEERRLFYVAITRARDRLVISSISSASVNNKVLPLEPSRFLQEVGLEPIPREV
jgi:DNA helicase-2/ATP-dependent DNA helicase PcrA